MASQAQIGSSRLRSGWVRISSRPFGAVCMMTTAYTTGTCDTLQACGRQSPHLSRAGLSKMFGNKQEKADQDAVARIEADRLLALPVPDFAAEVMRAFGPGGVPTTGGRARRHAANSSVDDEAFPARQHSSQGPARPDPGGPPSAGERRPGSQAPSSPGLLRVRGNQGWRVRARRRLRPAASRRPRLLTAQRPRADQCAARCRHCAETQR